jgi:DNA-binding GntR family transcriptional regulator
VREAALIEGIRVSRELLSRKIADALRPEIVSGRIPDGTRLVEEDLASRLGVSRAPVREALAMLEQERLVSSTPGKGTYVRALDADSVRQLFAVRTLLESFAAELAAERIASDQSQAASLRELAGRFAAAASAGRASELADLDLAIHRRIWDLSGNEHLADVLRYLTRISGAILSLDAERTANWREVAPKTHRQLVDAVASGDPRVAGDWIRADAAAQLASALSALGQTRDAPDSAELPATRGPAQTEVVDGDFAID